MISSDRIPNFPQQIMTVQGPLPYKDLGITDTHNHIWIDVVPGSDPSSPVLNQYQAIIQELSYYRQAGGAAILDCQPGGCGRDGNRLVELSQASQVHILACTGFHRKKYYSPGYWLWSASAQAAADHFISELEIGLVETLQGQNPVKAGFIKLALEAEWNDPCAHLLEGAASAAVKTGAMVALHTEKGALAEEALDYFEQRGVAPNRVVICHIDKRPDFGLHTELALRGALLEYDSFFRPKYQPEQNLWPLIERMTAAGLAHCVALATDMAEAAMYRSIGGGPGLASLPGIIRTRLQEMGIPDEDVQKMIGKNIIKRLAGMI